MGRRINNLSARLLMNEWLADHGFGTLPGTLSYEQFATALRAIITRGVVHVPFIDRADAVGYIRLMAAQRAHLSREMARRSHMTGASDVHNESHPA